MLPATHSYIYIINNTNEDLHIVKGVYCGTYHPVCHFPFNINLVKGEIPIPKGSTLKLLETESIYRGPHWYSNLMYPTLDKIGEVYFYVADKNYNRFTHNNACFCFAGMYPDGKVPFATMSSPDDPNLRMYSHIGWKSKNWGSLGGKARYSLKLSVPNDDLYLTSEAYP